MSNYDQRFVAFIDILGFSDLVKRSEKDDDIFIKLANITINIDEKVKQHRTGSQNEEILGDLSQLEVVNFSDSLILSETSDATGFWKIVLFINTVFFELAQYGTLCRGAISYGSFYQKGTVAFGPAFLEAYHLENKIANFPRVLISRSALNKAQEFAANKGWGADYLKKWIVRDLDGAAYVDQFGDCVEIFSSGDPEMIDLYSAQFNVIGAEIQQNLQNNVDKPDIFEKYSWFTDEYNNMVSKCKAYSPNLVHIDKFGVAPNEIRLRDPDQI